MTGSDFFGWTVMAIGTVAGIAFLDFIQRNLPDALDDPSGDFSDADSRTASLRNALDDGGRTPARIGGGEATSARGLSVTNGSQTGVQVQINTQFKTTSTSPANCAGQGS
jgi:hypothetical protein